MTIKKAIEILDWILNNKTKTVEEFLKPQIINAKSEIGMDLYRTILHVTETDIYNLNALKEELVPDCKHPKKMRDRTPDGQWYCTNCNLDL